VTFEPARRARSRGDFRALDEETSTRRVLRGCWLRKLRILPQPTFARDVARCASLEVLRQLECQSTRAEWPPPVARASQCVARLFATDQEQLRLVDDVPDYWYDRYDTLAVRLRSRQHPPRETYQYSTGTGARVEPNRMSVTGQISRLFSVTRKNVTLYLVKNARFARRPSRMRKTTTYVFIFFSRRRASLPY